MSYDSRPDTYEHIGRVRRYLGRAIVALLDRADGHDASKLVDPERETFDRVTPLLHGLSYGSAEYRAALESMGPALAHHYAANRHHPEFHAAGINGMTLIDLIEMLCDWRAATERHADGDLRRSLRQNQVRFGYSDELLGLLERTAEVLWPAADAPAGGGA